jgi:hypothetical protein
LTDAGKPAQNACVESFNGKFRDECLNEHWFHSLAEARPIIAGCATVASAARADDSRAASGLDPLPRTGSYLDRSGLVD